QCGRLFRCGTGGVARDRSACDARCSALILRSAHEPTARQFQFIVARVSKDGAPSCFETHRSKRCDAPQHEADRGSTPTLASLTNAASIEQRDDPRAGDEAAYEQDAVPHQRLLARLQLLFFGVEDGLEVEAGEFEAR